MVTDKLPLLLSGPVVRRTDRKSLSLWLVTSVRCDITLSYAQQGQPLRHSRLDQEQHLQTRVGQHCFIHNLSLTFPAPMENGRLCYDLTLHGPDTEVALSEAHPELRYAKQRYFCVPLNDNPREIFHGSCRKPHYPGQDALVTLDSHINERHQQQGPLPDMLMMTGDQIYADDVAGPMLVAIHQLMDALKLYPETLDGAQVANTAELLAHPHCYYQRTDLLDVGPGSKESAEIFWATKRKPIFTTVNGDNHLVTLAEVLAMYLLVWSPRCWQLVDLNRHQLPNKKAAQYAKEQNVIEAFAANLGAVSRLMANLPCYMIFDDHDVTDDWNLSRDWEETAYSHPFSRRIIGNALIGYLLCQGMGNAPAAFTGLHTALGDSFADGLCQQDELIDTLVAWHRWHYSLPTEPKVVVLDTRTQRWRSEENAHHPSGLMSWETLCELQQELIDHDNVVLVSPAPIFGVKLIEVIQRIFTFFGQALTVDAENWMAHKGTASVMLNIFRHPKTPHNFVILSGDVHYSFVYDIQLRFKKHSPRICQFTASGLKNTFPEGLILWLDRLNRWLFHPKSPLNWFTRRRRMAILPRRPTGFSHQELLNHTGVGRLQLGDDTEVVRTSILCSDSKQRCFSKG